MVSMIVCSRYFKAIGSHASSMHCRENRSLQHPNDTIGKHEVLAIENRRTRLTEDTAKILTFSLPFALMAKLRKKPVVTAIVVQSSSKYTSCMDHDKHP